MAVQVRSSLGSSNAGGAATIVMTMPSGVVNGDLLVMQITARGGTGTTITTPAGWNLLSPQINSTTVIRQVIYWRVASSEPASYTVTLTSNKASGVIIAMYGGVTGLPLAVQFTGQANAAASTIASPALGAFGSAKNGLDLFIGGIATGTAMVQPVNYTLAATMTSSGGSATTRTTSGIAYRSLSGVTTVGAVTSQAYGGTASVTIGHHLFIYENTSPTVILNTTNGITFNTSTPTLEFTPTDLDGDLSAVEFSLLNDSGGFTELPQGGLNNVREIAVNSTTKDLFVLEIFGYIEKQTGGVGWINRYYDFGFQTSGLAVNSSNGDIYVTATAGPNQDIYKQTGGVGSFIGLGMTTKVYNKIAVNSSNGDVYVAVTNDGIYKQTAGTGTFVDVSLINSAWIDVDVDSNNGDVYALVSDGSLYKQSNGTGNFNLLFGTGTAFKVKINPVTKDLYIVSPDLVSLKKRVGGIGSFITVDTQGYSDITGFCVDSVNNDLYLQGTIKDGATYYYTTINRAPILLKVSETDSGFLNTITPANLSPFNSGQKISYTFQTPLNNRTYYWRVRAKDPSGSNNYGAYSTSNTFTIDAAQVQSSTKRFAMLGVG